MNKKILALLLILIAISTISIVSAQDTKTIGGVEFNVPEGYTYDADSVSIFLQAFDDDGAIEDVGVFKSSSNDPLAILVYNGTPDMDYPSDYEIVNKTISGKNGSLVSAPSRANVVFMYNDKNKFVLIQAIDEATIEKTIK